MMRRPWFNLLCGLLAALVFLAGMAEYRARTELALARTAAASADDDAALRHYSRAINWYVPFGSAGTAAEELLNLGFKWRGQGRDKQALIALDRVRSMLYGSRSLYTPRTDLIDRAEPVIAELRALEKLGREAAPDQLRTQARIYLELMTRHARPRTGPALAATGGFVLWVLAAFLFIFRFFRRKDTSWAGAWPWAVLWMSGFALWLGGLAWS